MTSRNVETYRAGHEAFNQRDFEAMTKQYADSITWTDRARGLTFRTSQEFKDDFLAGWVLAASNIRITDPRYIDAGQTVVCTFTAVGTHDGPLGPLPATGKEFALALCEMWHFDSSGAVVGGDLYYDQVSLLMQLGLMPQPAPA
jgi:predicted ester cyclase